VQSHSAIPQAFLVHPQAELAPGDLLRSRLVRSGEARLTALGQHQRRNRACKTARRRVRDKQAMLKRSERHCLRARESVAYLVLLVVYQICGAPFTPDFSIAAFNSAEAANALAFSRL